MRQEEQKVFDQGFIIIMMIWGSILASLIIYLVVCIFLDESYMLPVGEKFPIAPLKNAFYIIAFVISIGIRFVRNKLIPEKGNRSDNRVQFYVGKYNVAVLVSSVLCEFIGILGLVLWLLSKNFADLYIFLGISAAALIFYRPKKSELMELMS